MPNGEGMLKYENDDVFIGTFDHGVLNRKGKLMRAKEQSLSTHGTKNNNVVMISNRANLNRKSQFSLEKFANDIL